MYQKPLINGGLTIITVVFNDAAKIESTILSVLEKKTDNIEYIVIDGGSTDGTVHILEAYKNSIDIIVSEPDSGIYDAMNKGAERAKPNNFLFWLNSGDFLLQIPSVNCVSDEMEAQFYPIAYPNNELLMPIIHPQIPSFKIFPENQYHHQGFIIRKLSFDEIKGYNTNVGLYADCLLMETIIRRGKYDFGESPLACYDMGGITTQKHFSILISYFKVGELLGFNRLNLIKIHWKFIIKRLLKILIPKFLMIYIIKLRWG